MTRLPLHPASPLAATWLYRLYRIEEALDHHPHSARAWRWRMEAKVLRYFLSRYGDDPTLNARHEPAPPPTPPHELHFEPADRPWTRSRSFLRQRLVEIAAANRYVTVQDPPEPVNPFLRSFSCYV